MPPLCYNISLYFFYVKITGEDCSQVGDRGYWEVIEPRGVLPKGSASHTAVVWRDSLHVIGGESYNRADFIYTYDFTGNIYLFYFFNIESFAYGKQSLQVTKTNI